MNVINTKFFLKLLFLIAGSIFLIACGGGGGGGGDSAITPPTGGGGSSGGSSGSASPVVISFSSSASELEIGSSATLSWSAANADQCEASGSWSGAKGASGSETFAFDAVGNYSFTLNCSNSNLSSTATVEVEAYRTISGTVLDGYIRGANIFVDTNNDQLLDSNEFSTDSNNNGVFNGLRQSTGSVISKGGFDVDTGIHLENLLMLTSYSGEADNIIISPITTAAYFLTNPSDINNIFGIDNNIDIYTHDPILNISDEESAALYLLGNRLTILALALENIHYGIKDADTFDSIIHENTDEYFKLITEAAASEYYEDFTTVNIDAPEFVNKLLDELKDLKSVSIPTSAQALYTEIISSSLYVNQVKSSSGANLALQNFFLTDFQEDLRDLASRDGNYPEISQQYTNELVAYIASTQNIQTNLISPTIKAVDDTFTVDEDNPLPLTVENLLANDEYLRINAAFQTWSDADNGQWVDNFFYPDPDFNGIITFTYTIGQGGVNSTGTVTIEVLPVNDPPELGYSNCSFEIDNDTAFVCNFTAADIDQDSLSFSVKGDDSNLFSITNNGALSFKTNAIHDDPKDSNLDNTYVVTVVVSDGLASTELALTIDVLPKPPDLVITGSSSYSETLIGGAGNDLFNPGRGDATIDGGAGTDEVVFFSSRSSARIETLRGITRVFFDCVGGNDENLCYDYYITNVEKLTFTNDSVSLETALPASLISGSRSSSETLTGDSSDNIFDPGRGDATIDGGAGTDEVVFFSSRSSARIETLRGITRVFFDCVGGNDENLCYDYYITNVEKLTFTNDSVSLETALPASLISGSRSSSETLTGDSSDNIFDPGRGDATIDGGAGTDEVVFFSSRSSARIETLRGITRVFFDCVGGNDENLCYDYYITNVEKLTFTNDSVSLETALPASLISGSRSSSETLTGDSSDNIFDPGRGDATIDGGAGTDEVLFFSSRSRATITTLSGITKITFDCVGGNDENLCYDYELTNIEIVTFTDESINL